MAYLSAESILGAVDLVSEDVEVPEWGGTVRVQGMTGAERDRFEAGFLDNKGKAKPMNQALADYRARIAAACIVDETGKKMFRSDAEVRRLGEKSAQALSRVAEVASRLSGLSDEDQGELLGN